MRLHQLAAEGREQFGERTARKFLKQILSESNLLATHPYIGRLEPYLAHLPGDYRSLVVHSHYKLVYRVDEERETVIILALWDTRQDPARLTDQL